MAWPRQLVIAMCAVGFMAALARADDVAVSNDTITVAVKKAVGWIYRQQKPWGTWEAAKLPTGIERNRSDQGQFGMTTALAVHALLAGGESESDPRLISAINFLITSDRIDGVYAVGMRAQVWPLLAQTPAVRQAMGRDRNILLDSLHMTGATRGLFSYRTEFDTEANYADHGVSFFGTLGVKALSDAGIEIPDRFWRLVDRAWRSQESHDGSWVYQVGSAAKQEHTMSMTAGGVAVLFTTDQMAAVRPLDCRGLPPDRNIESGLNWIDKHFDRSRDPHDLCGYTLENYGLYSVADVGLVSGRKYFNQRDWYEDGAQMLLGSQNGATGAWGNLPDTCLAVMFLVRGRNPVILSKLQYNIAGAPGHSSSASSRPGNWNLRPRDVANLTDWVGRQVEREFNWQSVSLKVPVEELHDSAVLYIAGNQALNLAAEDKAKLRAYVQEGGMLVGNADCGNADFSAGFRKLGTELFPAYEFRAIPRDSVIYTGEQYRAAKWKQPPQVLELNNGVRDLMLLVPRDDPSRSFQLRQQGSRLYLYELMADILFYSVDQDGTRLKGETYIIRPDPGAHVQKTVKVARLQYDGNWDPEPGGWPRLAAFMHNQRGIDLQVVPVRPEEGKLDNSYAVAHLTGTAGFHLSDSAVAQIRKYFHGGGTLVIDAAGGSAAFGEAALGQIKAIITDGNLDRLAPDHPVYTAGEKLNRAAFRRFARSRLVQSSAFRLAGIDSGQRTELFYSAEDLSEGLVGEPIDGVVGYQPQTATCLMANLITYAASK